MLGGDAKLHESGQVGRAICREGDHLHEDVEPETKLERLKRACRYLRRVEKVTCVMRGNTAV